MAQTLARRLAKTIFFLIIMFAVARILSDPEIYINHTLASRLALLISGDVNAESIYDAYFYIDVASVLIITTGIYIVVMKLINKIRKK
ncbi:hypothetical protein LU604_04830 [Erwinia tracheiphila]|uniref:Uncharacterized protein n=1 Tax=Erwinia tracheiphila TaxID=65700 RepID=A0A345CU57_9GAMM|nr:hypothetical protein [Erwinia tracheiphila]AXF76974.1 hypothetical protein AV903_14510 [Erwinia tracheiphila]UIA84347.1 hypothetical protein LU604_04830 [Erwinia tracheiphila]UIA92930.1 hypothetical protein LU632_04790 [Erwinia tracheiphila]